MGMGILAADAAKVDAREAIEAEFGGLQRRVLAGEDEGRLDPVREQCPCDRPEFDGFRPGPDDQPYIGGTQVSP
jgi:hypothetical protein